jgi:hypothetical protein
MILDKDRKGVLLKFKFGIVLSDANFLGNDNTLFFLRACHSLMSCLLIL